MGRSQHDFNSAVARLVEQVICLHGSVQREAVGNDGGRIEFSTKDQWKNKLPVVLHMYLRTSQSKPLLHDSSDGEAVDGVVVVTNDSHDAALPYRTNGLAQDVGSICLETQQALQLVRDSLGESKSSTVCGKELGKSARIFWAEGAHRWWRQARLV